MSKIKSPLKKRVFRELIGEWRKYLVIAVFLIVMIGFISGLYVANNSMQQIIIKTFSITPIFFEI